MKCAKNRLSKDYEGRCGNCHEPLGDDAYCRYCGTKAGEGSYKPYEDVIMCIYGPPPVERKHICNACGYTWSSCAMIDKEKYCPKCGGTVVCEEVGRPYDEI